jgi:hypothetical protein
MWGILQQMIVNESNRGGAVLTYRKIRFHDKPDSMKTVTASLMTEQLGHDLMLAVKYSRKYDESLETQSKNWIKLLTPYGSECRDHTRQNLSKSARAPELRDIVVSTKSWLPSGPPSMCSESCTLVTPPSKEHYTSR